MLDRIDLLTLDEPVTSFSGMVYSTAPKTGTAENGTRYYVKGPDPAIVFAELAGCLLAKAVGLTVAPVALCCIGGEMLSGSESVTTIGRNVAPFLQNPAPRAVANFDEIYAAIIVDVWLGNEDRNLGNVVARQLGGGRVEFVFIDFEKSAALREFPVFKSGAIEPRKLWPTNELGDALRPMKPLQPPSMMVSRIKALVEDEGRVAHIIGEVSQHVSVPWQDGSVDAVIRRGSSIARHAGDVWNL